MKIESVFKYFPPPQFLMPRHVGISFSNSSIKAVSLRGSSVHPEIKSMVLPLEKGLISDGKILNDKEVTKKISEIRNFFKTEDFVFFAVPDELVYLFKNSASVVNKGDISENIAFSIEENVPLTLSEALFDFKPITVAVGQSGYEVGSVVTVSARKEIEKFTEVIKAGGFDVLGSLHESQAIANAVMPESFVGSACVVHARGDRLGIYLVKDQTVLFATLRNVYEGSYESNFLDEYDKFLEYSSRYEKEEKAPIKTVFVCGEFESARKTVEVISNKDLSKREVKLANVWSNVLNAEKTPPKISYEDSLNFAGPIGVALSDIL